MHEREPLSKPGLIPSSQIQPGKQKNGRVLQCQQCHRTGDHEQVGIGVEMQRLKRLRFHLEQIERLTRSGLRKDLLSIGKLEPPGLMDAAATDRIAGDNRCPVKRSSGGV